MIYLILSILLRITLMVAIWDIVFIVVGTFIIVSNVIAIRFLTKFLNLLKKLEEHERSELLILQNGIPNRKSEDIIPPRQSNFYEPNLDINHK